MPGLFEPTPDGGAAVVLDEVEISIIRSLAVQLMELVGPGAEPSDDPLAELFAEGPSEPPSDPVLHRLFPDAYGGPGDKETEELRAASSEFRRFTENDLRDRKRRDAVAVIRSLDGLSASAGGGAVLKVEGESAQQWLGALNDLRLAISARLEITGEEDADLLYQLPDEDPRKPMVMAYLWLGGLQETLVETLMS
ncbi:DUF2017 domain-containing protein [Streptomyces tsukubensis]|uniref:Uncharacterized protein n=1 Tax=Streptomyces tsukubensis TaxID=83656 RepID=A0A1V4A258_9ACTN|nr:DUF2017 domain-containing protein [Streptomyces tsukubensis]OON72653.1 hypothetical protein B1H18_29270 [Streptomyces tsukubensis]QFR93840.1 DUF2017 family protein [Streptomyces tsukubensis]